MVKAVDSQPRDRGFESLHALDLRYLESLSRFVPEICNLAIHRESYCTLITRGAFPL